MAWEMEWQVRETLFSKRYEQVNFNCKKCIRLCANNQTTLYLKKPVVFIWKKIKIFNTWSLVSISAQYRAAASKWILRPLYLLNFSYYKWRFNCCVFLGWIQPHNTHWLTLVVPRAFCNSLEESEKKKKKFILQHLSLSTVIATTHKTSVCFSMYVCVSLCMYVCVSLCASAR